MTTTTIYQWASTPGNILSGAWFEWSKDVDVARVPLSNDLNNTVYYTGDGVPKKTDSTLAQTGLGDPPTDWVTLGIPAPAVKATVADNNASGVITGATAANPVVITDAGHSRTRGDKITITGLTEMLELNDRSFVVGTVRDADNFELDGIDGTGWTPETTGGAWEIIGEETRAYVYTYVSGDGEEGPISPVSDLVTTDDGTQVDLSAMSVAPAGDYDITDKRIYRTVTAAGVTKYHFLVEIAVATATYNDTTLTKDLGEELKSTNWIEPPTDMVGIKECGNGILAGFHGNEVCLCVPWLPHAWPTAYRWSTDYPIVAIGAFANTIVIATEKHPYLLVGIDPAHMSLNKLTIPQACSSKRSMAGLDESGVIYASPDGLVVIGTNGHKLVTESYFTRDQWQELEPETIIGFVHDARYIGFYGGADGGGFIFDSDPSKEGVTMLTETPTGGYVDHHTDTLYLHIESEIYAFDNGEDKEFTWESKEFFVDDDVFQAARVRAYTYYDLSFEFYADGVLKHTETVASSKPFRMPGGYRAKSVKFILKGTDRVYQAEFAATISELAA